MTNIYNVSAATTTSPSPAESAAEEVSEDFIRHLQQHDPQELIQKASVIKTAFKTHQIKKAQLRGEQTKRVADYGHVKATYKGPYLPYQGREYFFPTTEKHSPVLYQPAEKPHYYESGNFKVLHRADNRYVALLSTDPRAETCFSKRDNSDLATLKLNCVKYSVKVDDDLMIARNAGLPLLSKEPDDSGRPRIMRLDITAFKESLKALATLHENGIYLRDIKLANLAYDKQQQQVNFIDVDERASPTSTHIEPFGHREYTTVGLMAGAYPTPGEYDGNYLRTADEYAFLLAIIAATTSDKQLQLEVHMPQVAINILGRDGKKEIYGTGTGAMNSENQQLFTPWLKAHVKSEFIAEVTQLLSDPAAFTQESPNHPHLSEMLIITG